MTAVLVYGPIIYKEILEWCEYFSIEHAPDKDNLDILEDFLRDNELILVQAEDTEWEKCYIGTVIDNYTTQDIHTINRVSEFCFRYNLPIPTFFAGLV